MTITSLPELSPREPHEFSRDDDQPSWAPEGGYCRCGWIQDARVHAMLPAGVLTGDEQLSLPPGCRCGYALSNRDGLWHVISRDRCVLHADDQGCGRCGRPVAKPGGTRPDGTPADRARWCDECIDRCHEATDFAHICQLCATPGEAAARGWKVP